MTGTSTLFQKADFAERVAFYPLGTVSVVPMAYKVFRGLRKPEY